jgi:hypothetical protein
MSQNDKTEEIFQEAHSHSNSVDQSKIIKIEISRENKRESVSGIGLPSHILHSISQRSSLFYNDISSIRSRM